MVENNKSDVTRLLAKLHRGDRSARDRLFELVNAELKEIAAGLMRGERRGHTLQPTALVNEAAIRLLGETNLARLVNRAAFYDAASKSMRRILVDHARKRNTLKRGGDRVRVALDDHAPAKATSHFDDEVLLNDALKELELVDPRLAQVVVLRRYAGLTNIEIAEMLDVKLRTVEADFKAAKTWLFKKLKEHSCG